VIAKRLGPNAVDPAAHWPVTHGCLTPCVICDAPESDGEFAGFEAADGSERLRIVAAGQSEEHACTWCLEEAEARRESKQAEESGAALRALFDEVCIGDLD
jgi:hypothetical protein